MSAERRRRPGPDLVLVERKHSSMSFENGIERWSTWELCTVAGWDAFGGRALRAKRPDGTVAILPEKPDVSIGQRLLYRSSAAFAEAVLREIGDSREFNTVDAARAVVDPLIKKHRPAA